MEPTVGTISKRKHDVNNTSKTNNESNNDKSHNTNKDHVSNTNTSSKKSIRIRISWRWEEWKIIERTKTETRNEKKHRRIKTLGTEKENQVYL